VAPLPRSSGRVGRGSRRRSILTSCLDHGDDSVRIGQYFIVPEAQHQPAMFRKEPIAPFMLARLRMLGAIGLYGHPQRGAREVQHERRHRMLTSEMPTYGVTPQSGPETPLCVGGTSPSGAGEFHFLRHGRHPLPALPHAARGRGKWYRRLGCQLLDGTAHE
jgi:hypothetical protein